MGKRIQIWVRKQPITSFYFLAFTLTWLFWLPQALYSYGLFPFPCDNAVFYVLGGVGPLAAALITARALYGKRDGEEVFNPLFRWRVNIIWYVIAISGGAVIMLASMGLRGEPKVGLERLVPSVPLVISFFTYLVAAIPEEVAWRGFVLPRLQARYSALASSLIIGVLWALWHLPLLFIKGSTMASYSLLPYLLEVIADSVIYAWLYNNTRGSVLIVTLYHTITNVVGPNAGIQQAMITVILAVIIIIVSGPEHLSRQQGRVIQNTEINTYN